MDEINSAVDQLWEDVNAENSELMKDWIASFSEDYDEGKEKAKQEIRNTLTDPGKNFLWRLLSTEPWL